ncbi:MAG: lipid biosynthesis B12-binding/radical SAM protein [Thermodesulfobacteriota bacterium]
MSNILLISTNIAELPYPVYPLGMAVVAASLKAKGHQVEQFDWLAAKKSESQLRKAIRDFNPDYVGISLRNIDSLDSFGPEHGWYLAEVLSVTGIVKNETGAPIIAGGSAFSIMPENILEYLDIPYGIVGEGEDALCRLIQSIETGNHPPSIQYAESPLLSSTQMLSPLFSKELIRFYESQSGLVGLQSKRGCPHHCIYCTYPALEGRRLRIRNPKDVIEDIRQLTERFGIKTIAFTDSVFNDASGHYLSIAEELLAGGIQIRWSGFFRPSHIGIKELKLLKKSGLYAIELGTDGACDETLKGLNKDFAFSDVIEFNEACVQLQIPCAHYIMFGGPRETPDTLKKGLQNIEKLNQCLVFAFSGIRVLPKTELFAVAVDEGIVSTNETLLKPAYYFSPQIKVSWMNESIKNGFARRRDRIFPPSEGLMRIGVMTRFGFKGLLWDQLIRY